MTTVGSDPKRDLLERRLRRALAATDGADADAIPRRGETEPPLSYAQERLWFMEQYAPGTAAYGIPIALRLSGAIVPGALRSALDRVVARHDSLRARFSAGDDGRPRVAIAPTSPLPVDLPAASLVDLPTVDVADEAGARAVAATVAREPFDLAAGPLLRAVLIRLADDDHVLLVLVHHIAADGWSTDVLIGELVDGYDAAVTGVPGNQPPPSIQYGDFARWQRERLAERAPRHLAYWRERLDGVPPLDLPTDRPRPREQGYEGAAHEFTVDAALTAAVGALATRLGATPYMVMLAALEVVLWRHSGQRDFAIGSPVAGRLRPELEGLIGMFANVLALRADLRGEPTFVDLVARVRDTALDAYAHQEVPFEQLVSELRVHRDTSRPPLFQVALAMQNYARPDRRLAGDVALSWFAFDAGVTRFDLEIYLYEHERGLWGSVVYSRALFDRTTVVRLTDHLLTLLRDAVAEPTTPVADLPLDAEPLTAKTAAQGPRVVLPPTANLACLLAEQAAASPAATAVVADGRRLTYAELDERANGLAHVLIGQGVRPGDRVAISVERSVELVVGLVAIMKAGAAYVPLDPDYPAERLAYVRADAGAALLLTADDVAVGPLDRTAPDVTIAPDHAAYVIYTSGSTGRPKGVVTSHRAIVNRLDWMQREFGLDPADAVLQKTPAGFDVSVWEFFWPLLVGARLVLARPGGHRDPAYLREVIAREGITTIHFVPSMLSAFLGEFDTPDTRDPGSPLRRIVCSGEELTPALARRCLELLPSATLHNLYGPTEAAVDVSAWRCRPERLDGARVPIGRPIQNVDLWVLDERGRPQPVGIPGELHIGGTAVALGYLGRPALTADRFRPDPFRPGGRLYRTGDRARRRADGALEYLGRLDDQVKIRGVRVEPGEVEAVLRSLPGVADAVVTVREDGPDGRRLVAYVVPHAGAEPDPAQLRADLRRMLPDAYVPAAFVRLEALPLNPSGKLDRRALPPPASHRDIDEAARPRTAAEGLIAGVWAHVLGLDEVGLDDDFFDLGGHSLLAVQAVARLRRPLAEGCLSTASVMDLFRCPTVRLLAGHVSRPAATGPSRLLHELTARVEGETVRSFVCSPYGGGSAVVYRPLADALPPGQRLFALAPPGHDVGLAEEAQELRVVVARCVDEIIEHVPGPVVLYGHCGVGCATAIAVALGLQARGRPPEAVYIGGSFPFARPPGRVAGTLSRIADRERLLSDRVYATWLTGMGVDLSGLEADEVTAVVRAMRRDSVSAENFFTDLFAHTPPRLDAPIISIVGDRDPMTDMYRERFREWHALTDSTAVVALDEGGHYFVRYRAPEVAAIVTTAHERLADGTLAESSGSTWAVRGVSNRADPSTTDHGPRPGMGRFAVVAASQLVSMTGSALTEFALPLWLYLQTGSLVTFALLATLGLVPGLLVAPVAGAIVDRADRRRVMLAADFVAGGTQAAMLILWWTGDLGAAPLYGMVVVLSLALTFQRLAYASAIPQLVPKRYIGHANGLVQLSGGIAQFVVPLAAVALLAGFGIEGILILDALSYVVSVAALALTRFPRTLAHTRRESLTAEIVNGVRYSLGRRGLRAMLAYFAILNVFLSPLLLLVSPLTLSFGDLATSGQVALLGGLGAVLGGLTVSVWGGPRRDRMAGLLWFAVGLGAFAVVTGLRPAFAPVALGAAGMLFCLSVVNGVYATIVQVKVPQRYHGRVFALQTLVAWSTIPLGFAVVAPLGTRALEPLLAPDGPLASSVGAVIGVGPGRGIALLYVLFGLAIAALSLAALRHPALGRFDDITPDADPDDLVGLAALRTRTTVEEEPCSTTSTRSSSS